MATPRYTILHADETLLVVDKAAGVLSVAAPGLDERCLLDDLQSDGYVVQPVHRLDRDTSGVLLVCRDREQREALERAFRKREVQKHYLALVQGRLPGGSGLIDLPILDEGATARVARTGRPARTRFTRLLDFGGRAALVRAEPETGRHNQIRVHLAHIGCPLLGDDKFGRRALVDAQLPVASRALLHAERLMFSHPVGGERLDLHCEPPADFVAAQAALTERWPPTADAPRPAATSGRRPAGARPGRQPPKRSGRPGRRRR